MRLLLAAALLLMVPTVSADHWNDDYGTAPVGDSSCASVGNAACVQDYLCTGGAPPQVVDLVLHCVLRASGEAEPVALWVPFYAWLVLDAQTAGVDEAFGIPHDTVQVHLDTVNGILCGQVWSAFCSIPIVLPDHMPLSDPFQGYPL